MDLALIGVLLLALKVAGDAVVTAVAWTTGVFTILFGAASVVAAMRFFRMRRVEPWAQTPPVTIIKPLKGLDRGLYENLKSFCQLDYPRYQLLFTLASPDDPALPVLSRLRSEFPHLDLEIIVSKNRIGFNPKINNASNAAPFIKHDLLMISDSDVRVERDFLRRMTAPLRDERVGLVTAFYQATHAQGLWARLEALSVNAQFLPQAVVAASFGMRFAMGAAMLVRREAFEAAGGFQTMAEHLADDFILGRGVREAGYRLEIADCVVESLPDHGGAVEHLRHQVRWARTIRICNPGGYLGTFLLHGVSLLTLKIFLFGPDAVSIALVFAALASKGLAKAAIASWCLGARQSTANLLLLPWSEWVAFGAWVSGFRSAQVLWRGELYAVQSHGRLSPARAPFESPTPVGAP